MERPKRANALWPGSLFIGLQALVSFGDDLIDYGFHILGALPDGQTWSFIIASFHLLDHPRRMIKPRLSRNRGSRSRFALAALHVLEPEADEQRVERDASADGEYN
jgi:hypothetical protein